MSQGPPISDDEVHRRLHAAREALGDEPGATVHGNTALAASRKALTLFQIAVLRVAEPELTEPHSIEPQPSPSRQTE